MQTDTQNGSITLASALFFSLLLGLGGMGSAVAYQQKTPSQFFDEVHSIVSQIPSIAPLDLTPTPTGSTTPEETPADSATPTPTPTAAQTPTPTPPETITPTPTTAVGTSLRSIKSREEIHENTQAEVHESERSDDGENTGEDGSFFLNLFNRIFR